MNQRTPGNPKGFLTTYRQEAADTNLGLSTIMALAKKSGCLVKIGKTVRIRSAEFHEWLAENYGVE